jgi:hypothetical protein
MNRRKKGCGNCVTVNLVFNATDTQELRRKFLLYKCKMLAVFGGKWMR